MWRRVWSFLKWIACSAGLLLRRGAVPLRGAPSTSPLIVFYSQCAWFGPWQRPQELAVGLARRGHRMLYVSPMQVHERIGRFAGSKDLYEPENLPGLTVYSPLIFSGEYRWGWVFNLNKRIVARQLRHLLKNEGRIILLANTPLVEPLIGAIPHARFIYDVMDDYSAFDWAPQGSRGMEERLLRRADVVYTGTYALKEKVSPLRSDAEFVPCGVHFERFAGESQPRAAVPQWTAVPQDMRNLPEPRIGFVGTISERIDSELLLKIARAFPNASVVLIGPVYRTLGDPPQAPNLHYLGLKRHEELGAYLRAFDVGLLPFRMTQAVMAINPVKMLEYLAAGCVVVSTEIPDVVRFYSDVALIGETHEAFIEKLREALTLDQSERITRGIERARTCSWDAMVDAMARGIRPSDTPRE